MLGLFSDNHCKIIFLSYNDKLKDNYLRLNKAGITFNLISV